MPGLSARRTRRSVGRDRVDTPHRQKACKLDLGHKEKLDTAISVAARLIEMEGAAVTLCGVMASSQGSIAHTPEEFAQTLKAFAEAQSSARGYPSLSARFRVMRIGSTR